MQYIQGVEDIRKVKKAETKQWFIHSKNLILFIDEIHRFSKITTRFFYWCGGKKVGLRLIGATENPSFEVIPALLSRCQVYILNAFTKTIWKRCYIAMKSDVQLQKKHSTQRNRSFVKTFRRRWYEIIEYFELINATGKRHH